MPRKRQPIRGEKFRSMTDWNRETYQEKNEDLKREFKDAVNTLGFDSALGVRDEVLAAALVQFIWTFGRTYRDLRSEAAKEILEGTVLELEEFEGSPNSMKVHIPAGMISALDKMIDGVRFTDRNDLFKHMIELWIEDDKAFWEFCEKHGKDPAQFGCHDDDEVPAHPDERSLRSRFLESRR